MSRFAGANFNPSGTTSRRISAMFATFENIFSAQAANRTTANAYGATVQSSAQGSREKSDFHGRSESQGRNGKSYFVFREGILRLKQFGQEAVGW
jgi:hypothetical protein